MDDVEYFDEPMFEDGVVADAVDQAVARGCRLLFGGRQRRAAILSVRVSPLGAKGAGRYAPRFRSGPGVADLQRLVAPPGTISLLSLQWDQPSLSANGMRGSQSDVDAIFYNMDGTPVAPCTDSPAQLVCQEPGIANNIGADAVELPVIVNLADQELQVQLGIELVSGPAPGLLKYVWYDLGCGVPWMSILLTRRTAPIVGHANAAGAEAVGAAAVVSDPGVGQSAAAAMRAGLSRQLSPRPAGRRLCSIAPDGGWMRRRFGAPSPG